MTTSLELLRAETRANQRVLLVGPPGCGKTESIRAAAQAEGYSLEVIRLSLSERVDLSGALVPDVAGGICRQLPLEQVAGIRRRAESGERILLLLDDLGQAPLDVQAAAMVMFDKGFFPASVLLWGATNRPQDKASVCGLCEPLRSRFNAAYTVPVPDAATNTGTQSLGTWAEHLESWLTWAVGAGMPAIITSWHAQTNGRTLYQWRPASDPAVRMPDFRSWEAAGRRWTAGLRSLASLSACLSPGTAAEFLAFARLESELPTAAEILVDPSGCRLPSGAAAQWLLAGMLVEWLEEPHHGAAILTAAARLPRALQIYTLRTASRAGKVKILSRCREWTTFVRENSDLLSEIAEMNLAEKEGK